jgi:hypothetical protein
MDGTASLCVYELKQQPIEATGSPDFITREEFEKAMEELQARLLCAIPQNTAPAATAKLEQGIAKMF